MSDDAWHTVPFSHLGNPAGLSVVKSQNLADRKKCLGAWPSWSEEVGHSSVHSFNKYLWNRYHVPSSSPGPWELYVWIRGRRV